MRAELLKMRAVIALIFRLAGFLATRLIYGGETFCGCNMLFWPLNTSVSAMVTTTAALTPGCA